MTETFVLFEMKNSHNMSVISTDYLYVLAVGEAMQKTNQVSLTEKNRYTKDVNFF